MRRIIGSSFALLLLVALLVHPLAAATDHVGRVTLSGGTPVPGARVTATQGGTTLTTTTDAQGAYRLPALADGMWSIEVAMVGFSTQRRDVAVGTAAAASTWELSVMPFAEITRGMTVPAPAPSVDRRAAASQRNPGRAAGPGALPGDAFQRAGVAPPELPGGVNPGAARGLPVPAGAPAAAGRGAPPPLPPLDAGGDAFLVSGSVNTGAAQPSVGNQVRPTGLRLIQGQVSISGASSAWDARPFSLTGPPSA